MKEIKMAIPKRILDDLETANKIASYCSERLGTRFFPAEKEKWDLYEGTINDLKNILIGYNINAEQPLKLVKKDLLATEYIRGSGKSLSIYTYNIV